MTCAEELLRGVAAAKDVLPSESDPLRDADGLLETQLLDVRVHALVSAVGLLFELRTAMEFTEGDTAILVARGVREFAWSAEPRPTDRTAWNVVGSTPLVADGLFTLELVFLPDAQLRLTAESAEFYVADCPSLTPGVPDYETDDDTTIRGNLPTWDSPLTLLGASFLA